MGVREFYKGKNILLTGSTGFLGKVLLEKILRTIPDIGTIYLLIRKKEGSSNQERLKRSITESVCFDKIRSLRKDFDNFIASKLVVISGDLDKENMKLSDQERDILIENVHIIINCAEIIDYNSRLDEAIRTNIRGPLKLLELAKKIKNLEHFVHVSSAFVNTDKTGAIEEKVYTLDSNPDSIIKEIEKIPNTQIEARTSSIIGRYPNTYTFTKAMCERILEKQRENVPMTFIRPSHIGCAWRDPYPGWIENVSATSAIYLFGGMGVLKVASGDPDLIADQIPVDMVVDTTIVSAAHYSKSDSLNVVHCTSSTMNPITWGACTEIVKSYWNENPPEKRVGPCTFKFEKNEKVLKFGNNLRLLPILGYRSFANFVDSADMKKTSNKKISEFKRAKQLSDMFQPFASNEWLFLTNKSDEINKFCSEDEKAVFNLNVRTIQWKKYLLYHAWGLRYFILKENCDAPAQGDLSNVLATSGTDVLSAMKWFFNRGYEFRPSKAALIKSRILNSERVKNVIRNTVVNKMTNMSDTEFTAVLNKAAAQNCDFILSTYDFKFLRILGSLIHMIFRQIYDKIVVDEKILDKIRNYDEKKGGPLIIMPTHRSYLDFMLVSYIFYAYSIKCPHIVAAEDFLNIALVHHLLRASGALFIRRKKIEHMEVYWAVLYEYLQYLLLDECWLEFFIEGTRSRYGKTLAPKLGVLGIVADTVFDDKIKNVTILPITMSYERVIEGESYPYELLGEEKKKESLSRLIGAVSILKMNFGRVHIEVCDPINLKEYTAKYGEQTKNPKFDPYLNMQDRKAVVSSLGNEVVYQLNENLVILPTSMVSSLLLLYRKGINVENLVGKIDWLKNQILIRGGRIGGIDEHSSLKTIHGAIAHLQHLVDQKKEMVTLQFSAKSDYKNVLMLAYYRNMLIQVFWLEAQVACALSSFGQDLGWKEGVNLDRLWEELNFLTALMQKEYYLREKITKDNFKSIIELMVQRKILALDGDKVRVVDDMMMAYLCHLIWPFVESYWVTSIFMFNLKSRNTQTYEKKFVQEVQTFAESFYSERIIEFYEACSLDTLRNAISTFKAMKFIHARKKDLETEIKTEFIIEVLISEDALNQLQDHIKRFLKNHFAKSVNSPIELARKTMLIDYPFISKM